MSRIILSPGALAICLLLWSPPLSAAPSRLALGPLDAAVAAPTQAGGADELPDGDLDLPDGELDQPEPEPDRKPAAPAPEPEPEPEPDRRPVAPAPEPEPEPEEPLPPDERPYNRVEEPAAPHPDLVSPWEEEAARERANGRRPIEGGSEAGTGSSPFDEDGSIVDSPLFWGGIAAGGVALVVGGVIAGVIIYNVVGSDTGTIVITLE